MPRLAMLSIKHAARRPSPPLPRAASGSAHRIRAGSTPRSPSATLTTSLHRRFPTTSLNRRPIRNSSYAKGRKRVYYMSLEFLIGSLFKDVVGNLRCNDVVSVALGDLGVDPARMRCAEPDAALGNGGLGRLAACFMESMASLGIPACGYGIRYDHGLFQQVIKDGWQQEYPEQWLSFGNPWEFERPEVIYDIQFGGWVEKIV